MVPPAVAGIAEPVLGATPAAAPDPSAGPAFGGKDSLPRPEGPLPRRVLHMDKASRPDVPEFPFLLNEEIAGKNVAVVFDDEIIPAGLKKRAFRRLGVDVAEEKGIEETDIGLFSGSERREPPVEHGHQESPEFFGRGRVGCRAAAIRGIRFHAGDELHVPQPQRPMEFINFACETDGIIVDDRQGVDGDAFIEQKPDFPGSLGPCAAAGRVLTVPVMDMFRAVEREADQKSGFLQEEGPFPIEDEAVRLEPVQNGFTARIAGFKIDGLSEKIEARERGLPALPADIDDFARSLEGLADGFFEDFGIHAMDPGFGEEGGPGAVKTVSASQTAIRSGGLDEERRERFFLEELISFHVEPRSGLSLSAGGCEFKPHQAVSPRELKRV